MNTVSIKEFKNNIVKSIADDWALLSAGNENSHNAMTVSWGGAGELWGKDVVFVFVRPQRYTKEFIDREGKFSLCFFDGEYKKELTLFGRKSGRDTDKYKETGFKPVFRDGTVFPEEASSVLICKTLAVEEINPESFIDKSIDEKNYPSKDYHKVYIAEIEKVLIK